MPTKIDQYSLTTVPVEQYANDKLLGCATSFVWKHGERHFLITNWHIATGKNAQTEEQLTIIRPEYLRAHFNLRFDNFGKEQRDIKLYDNDGHQLWFAHPDFRTRRTDVVAIPLDIRSGDLDINLHPINLLRSEVDLAVSIGMDVFILGYPFGHKPPGFPVWKRGSIASEPDLTHSDLGYMLVDTASLPGMSGAPVIRRSWSALLISTEN
jgi:hypothetical protein